MEEEQPQPKREVVSEDDVLRLVDSVAVFDLILNTHEYKGDSYKPDQGLESVDPSKINKIWSDVESVFKTHGFLVFTEELEAGVLVLHLSDIKVRPSVLISQTVGANKIDLLINFEKQLDNIIHKRN